MTAPLRVGALVRSHNPSHHWTGWVSSIRGDRVTVRIAGRNLAYDASDLYVIGGNDD